MQVSPAHCGAHCGAVGGAELCWSSCRSYLDMMKVIIFSYMFWFVLTIIFITGTTR